MVWISIDGHFVKESLLEDSSFDGEDEEPGAQLLESSDDVAVYEPSEFYKEFDGLTLPPPFLEICSIKANLSRLGNYNIELDLDINPSQVDFKSAHSILFKFFGNRWIPSRKLIEGFYLEKGFEDSVSHGTSLDFVVGYSPTGSETGVVSLVMGSSGCRRRAIPENNLLDGGLSFQRDVSDFSTFISGYVNCLTKLGISGGYITKGDPLLNVEFNIP